MNENTFLCRSIRCVPINDIPPADPARRLRTPTDSAHSPRERPCSPSTTPPAAPAAGSSPSASLALGGLLAVVAVCGRGPRRPNSPPRDRQVGHLPVPAGRAEPVRDVRPQAGRSRRHPHRRPASRRPRCPASSSATRCSSSRSCADKLTIVRSFQTNNAGHNIQPIVGPDSLNANIGVALLARRRRRRTRRPACRPTPSLFPQAVCADVAKGQGRGDIAATGSVGSGVRPVRPRRRRPAAEEPAAQPAAPIGSTTAASCSTEFDQLHSARPSRSSSDFDREPASRRARCC